ncbi:MAG TPA: hypothetical protein PK779_14030, partial [Niabella sp.]|nr:hypothetical protein [Niabella sp.]
MKRLIFWIAVLITSSIFTETFAQQCSGKDEVKVTNVNQVKGMVNVTKRTQSVERGKDNTYALLISKPKGHRRNGACCQFNSGWCGRFSNGMVTV